LQVVIELKRVFGFGHNVLLFRQVLLSGGGGRKIDQSIDLIERNPFRSSTNIGSASKDQ